MRQYIRLHAWDFLLTVLIAIGMHLNTFSAFMIRESYMTNYLLVAAVTTVVMAVMFVIGYSKRKDIEEQFGLSSQKIAAILNRNEKFVKATEGKGKVKATWTVA